MNIGDKLGNWTVVCNAPDRIDSSGKHHKRVLVKCDCGTIIEKDVYKLKHGAKMCKRCYLQIAHNNSIPFKHIENRYKLLDDYGIGYTTNTNNEFFFDIEDYNIVKEICWYEDTNGYIYGYDTESKKRISLHRYVKNLNKESDSILDHINRNPKDCRKANLRLCSKKENAMNRSLYKNNKSGKNGVSFDKNAKKWIAYINLNRKRHYLGSFKNIDDAICVRRKAEEEYFGEYCPK